MEEIDLNPTDKTILEMLTEGRCSPSYIAEKSGYSRQNITNRLVRLVEHGYVEKLHPGLYELEKDPRNWRQLESVDEFKPGGLYEIPTLGRVDGRSWRVNDADSEAIYYMKENGQSGQPLDYDESPPMSGRTLRELVNGGEVFAKVDES